MTAGAYPDVRRIGTEVSLARGLEAGGYYNLAKLLWALAFADEIRRSQIGGLPHGEEALVRDLGALQRELELSGASPETLAYLERGLRGVAKKAELAWSESGEIAVCRSCGHLLIRDLPDRCPGCGAWRLTFRHFPPVHFLEPLAPEIALDSLRATPRILEGLMAGLTPRQMLVPPAPDEWS